MKGKIFSPQDATRMLPLVRRIVMDVKACTKLLHRLERSVVEIDASADGRRSRDRVEERADVAAKIRRLRERLETCEKELNALGCFLDDPCEGVVKFYGERDSRIVYLTWRLGEREVSFWHPTEKGHVDRQPIDGGERMAENAPGR